MSTLYFASDWYFVLCAYLSPFFCTLVFQRLYSYFLFLLCHHHDPISFAIPEPGVYYDLGNNRTTIATILRNALSSGAMSW